MTNLSTGQRIAAFFGVDPEAKGRGNKPKRIEFLKHFFDDKEQEFAGLVHKPQFGLSDLQVERIKDSVEKAKVGEKSLDYVIGNVAAAVRSSWETISKSIYSYLMDRESDTRLEPKLPPGSMNFLKGLMQAVDYGLDGGIYMTADFIKAIPKVLRRQAGSLVNSANYIDIVSRIHLLSQDLATNIPQAALIALEKHLQCKKTPDSLLEKITGEFNIKNHRELNANPEAKQEVYARAIAEVPLNSSSLEIDTDTNKMDINYKKLTSDEDFASEAEEFKQREYGNQSPGTGLQGCPGNRLIKPLTKHIHAVMAEYVFPHLDAILEHDSEQEVDARRGELVA